MVTRRRLGLLLLGAGVSIASAAPFFALSAGAQEQAQGRPAVALVARDYRYSPDRIEVVQDDLVKLTIRSDDHAYSFTIDEYRIVRRVPAGGTTTFEFRADRPGTFRFYSNLTNDSAHAEMQGQLVVRPR